MMADRVFSTVPFAEKMLGAHQFQGQTNDCAVISVAMVLNVALGSTIRGSDLGKAWGRLQWHGFRPVLRRIPRWAAFPWSMVAELREHGFTAHWHLLKDETFLADQLADNRFVLPIIGRWRPLWAHVMVLLAIHSEDGFGFANPAINKKQIDWMPRDTFLKGWRAFGSTVVVAHLASLPPTQEPR